MSTAVPTAPQKPRRRGLYITAGLAAAAVLLIVILLATGVLGKSPLETASEKCDLPAFALRDAGDTLVLSGIARQEGAVPGLDGTQEQLLCVLRETDAPSSVLLEIGQTRALDGRQSADWDDVQASWTYHPDAGLNVIFESGRR